MNDYEQQAAIMERLVKQLELNIGALKVLATTTELLLHTIEPLVSTLSESAELWRDACAAEEGDERSPETVPERAAMTDDSYPMRDSECFVHRISVLRDRLRLAPATELHVACRDALDEIERLHAVIAERDARVTSLEQLLRVIRHESAFYSEPDGDDIEVLCAWIDKQIDATLTGEAVPE